MSALRRLLRRIPLGRRFVRKDPADCLRDMNKTFGEWHLKGARDAANFERILHGVLTPGAHCVDIGANEGEFLRRFVELAPAGQHFAFEPIPHLAATLAERYPAVKVHACAPGDRAGRAEFLYVPEMPGWSGLRRQPYPVAASPVSLTVDVRRLDDVLPADLPIHLIKIDVEGGELGVLRGAVATLRRWRPHVLYEHAEIHAAGYGTRPEAVYDCLAECGLEVYRLNGSGPLTRREYRRTYDAALEGDYDRHAETNFWAKPGGERRRQ